MDAQALVALTTILPSKAQHSVDAQALQVLVQACKDTHSSGLSVWVDGKPYGDYTFNNGDARTPTFSAQKSIISLAIGRLLMDGRLPSIDTPVCHYFPEWKQGLKKTVTIRHLLNHTSAIEVNENDPDEWEPADVIQYALCADIIDTPGHYFLYNDKAVNLLRGIIQQVSGQRMDEYIAASFFQPMAITSYKWEYDKKGTPVNLDITPAELVKFGQLVLNKGKWNGQRLVSEKWLDESLAQAQPFVPNCGLLWWRIPERILYVVDDDLLERMKQSGVSEAFLSKFKALKGEYDNVNIPDDKLVAVFGKEWKSVLDKELYPYFPSRAKWGYSDEYIGYKAEGWLGQYVVIYPEKNLVACRMVKDGPQYDHQRDDFRDFEKYVYKLVK